MCALNKVMVVTLCVSSSIMTVCDSSAASCETSFVCQVAHCTKSESIIVNPRARERAGVSYPRLLINQLYAPRCFHLRNINLSASLSPRSHVSFSYSTHHFEIFFQPAHIDQMCTWRFYRSCKSDHGTELPVVICSRGVCVGNGEQM